jgi:hypothetical protein
MAVPHLDPPADASVGWTDYRYATFLRAGDDEVVVPAVAGSSPVAHP